MCLVLELTASWLSHITLLFLNQMPTGSVRIWVYNAILLVAHSCMFSNWPSPMQLHCSSPLYTGKEGSEKLNSPNQGHIAKMAEVRHEPASSNSTLTGHWKQISPQASLSVEFHPCGTVAEGLSEMTSSRKAEHSYLQGSLGRYFKHAVTYTITSFLFYQELTTFSPEILKICWIGCTL